MENMDTEFLFPNKLDTIEDNQHSLLEHPTPVFSNTTIRRAFVVWLYLGQQNEFRDVCNYYHRLEALENTMSARQRAASRQHEYTLFTNRPPTSSFLRRHFPNLYTQTHIESQHMRRIEAIRNECLFDYDSFNGLNDVMKQRVVEASQVIKKYCIEQNVPLREFLLEFKEFTERCELDHTIVIIESYIKKKTIHNELEMIGSYYALPHGALRKVKKPSIKIVTLEDDCDDGEVVENDDKKDSDSEHNTTENDDNIDNSNEHNTTENDDNIDNSNDNFDFHNLTLSDINDEPSQSEEYISIEYDSNQLKLLSGVTVSSKSLQIIEITDENKDDMNESQNEDSFKSFETSDMTNMSSAIAIDAPSEFTYKPIDDASPKPVIKRDGNNEVCLKIIDEYDETPFVIAETFTYREI